MTLVVKQYGEVRTGTNLLRMLLLDRHRDLLVLMHVLGDKHSEPVPLGEVYASLGGSIDAAHEFVQVATAARPAETTDLDDPAQAAFIARWARPIATAYAADRLPIVVSTKAPRAWLASVRRFETEMLGRCPTPAGEAIDRYTRRYRSWLALGTPDRPVGIVRAEDLSAAVDRTVRHLEQALGLASPARLVELPRRPVRPCRWDHLAPEVEHARLSPDRRTERCLGDDPGVERALEHLDPDLMVRLGYAEDGTVR